MSREMYRTVLGESFPAEMEISFGSGSERRTLQYRKVEWTIAGAAQGLRYGENPDQPAALYRLENGNLLLGEVEMIAPGRGLATDAQLMQSGKHPGKINITDVDAALGIMRYFADEPTAVIVKHNNPSGVAVDASLSEAYNRALLADRIAAFGGTIGLNGEVDAALAEMICDYYAEVVVAPEYTSGALAVFARKKNLRVLRIAAIDRLQSYVATRYVDFTSLIDGGIVAQLSFQPRDLGDLDPPPASVERNGVVHEVKRLPTAKEREDMRFGWFVESGVTSNSVIYVKDRCTVAIGTGEQDRVGVARIARDKAYWKTADRLAFLDSRRGIEEIPAGDERDHYLALAAESNGGLRGATMISDAFFPFRDGALVGLTEGVTAIAQPGGAIRDWDVIDAVNEFDATMIFTGQRSFRH
jgi:phosphoribosylaminoimidazolecarboxamide formyltransferase / IMP cyclohydrolase